MSASVGEPGLYPALYISRDEGRMNQHSIRVSFNPHARMGIHKKSIIIWFNGAMKNAVYGLGFIGAIIYYLSEATDFWSGLLGLIKAIVWPAFLIYELLKSLGA